MIWITIEYNNCCSNLFACNFPLTFNISLQTERELRKQNCGYSPVRLPSLAYNQSTFWTRGIFRGGEAGLCLPPPFSRLFYDGIFAVLLIFFFQNIKFRHSLTKASASGSGDFDPKTQYWSPWTPLGDFRPPDPTGPSFRTFLNMPLFWT